MRTLVLSWEYPPAVVGGLGRHVHALSEAMAAAGHEVTVISRHAPGAPADEIVNGVRVIRVPDDPPLFEFNPETLLAWTMAFNHAVTRAALAVCDEIQPEVVHAHDWLVAHAAATLKHHLGVPLVATMHATEAGRHQGWLPGDLNRSIHSVEWWLTYEARRVLACSEYMRWQITQLFELPPAKVDTVPNGVHPQDWKVSAAAVRTVRRTYGSTLDAPLLLFSGRLVYEKGLQDILAALPRLRRRHPGLRLVVAGDGPYGDELRAQARRLRLGKSVQWLGFVPGRQLASLAAAADCALVPSIYEPFGMVALEAAAAGATLVLSDTGGLAELAKNGVSALQVPAGSPAAIADAVSRLLRDEVLSRRLSRQARAVATRDYAWPRIAEQVIETYEQAVIEERELAAALRRTGRAPTPLRIVVPDGNLLADGTD
ncbi:glycosyltransferase family 4 protein [Fodinicola feengrottensis]|uniref:glycosyltransferase family 4 protein n=1 Tax=Fodinicola feengrottensis TaxID=435914 RepID=UPI0031D8AAD1